MPLAKCSFGMIPLSRHSVDRSPRAFHSSTHNVVRASCFEVLSASVESRKLFLYVSMCLAGRWPWSGCLGSSSWRQRSALAATFRRMWGGAIPASAYKNLRNKSLANIMENGRLCEIESYCCGKDVAS